MVELRGLSGELRASSDDGQRRIAGYAATFNSETQISGPFSAGGGFKETISPRAFDACLGSKPDVRCLFNHDPNQVLGRTKSGTLKLSTDSTGLHYSVTLPSSSLGDNVYQSVLRKDVSGSSFGFGVRSDSWDHDTNTRTLLAVDLFDAGPVTFPAYQQTSVSVRNTAGAMECIKIGWYRAGKLRVPLVGEREMRQRVKQLRQELDGADDDECDCECAECEAGNCSACDCEAGCDGTGCAAGECNCLERQASGRMRPAQGRTIYPQPDIWQLQEQRELEQKLFAARRWMKLARR